MSILSKKIHERLLTKKKKLDTYRPLPPALVRQLKESLLVEYIHSSNAIEGSTLTLEETRMVIEDGITIGGKSIKEHLEARNHLKAIAFIEELVADRRAIVDVDVLKLHRLVLEGIDDFAGKYREWGVKVSGSTFIPPLRSDVPKLIFDLLEWLRGNPDELSPVEFAALLLHKFNQVHPFNDGNGRVGRLLMNLVLIKSGYPFITNISYRDRKQYLRSLQEADLGNAKILIKLVARSVENALDNYLRAIEEPHVFSLAEASKKSGVNAEYLGLLVRKGTLPAYKRGSRWYVSENELKIYIETIRRK
ncbi:Fic family protein [Candidatus Bathyarchaeota archaeon]|nr:Fic family protein [Candidatus Bathyarchaeota archaeon]